MLIWPCIHHQIRSFFYPENATRACAFNPRQNALILVRHFHVSFNNHTAGNLTDTQHHVLFSGEELVWRGAGDAAPCSKFVKCEVALRFSRFIAMVNTTVRAEQGKGSSWSALHLTCSNEWRGGGSFSSKDGQPVTHPSRRQIFRFLQRPDITLTSAISNHRSPRGP